MKIVEYIIPLLLLALILYAVTKKVNVFESFVSGAKTSINTVFNIFPYIVGVLFMTQCLKTSGAYTLLTDLLAHLFGFLKIDAALFQLIVLKPISGSGSLAILGDIFKNYGVDSYVARTAAVIFGSSETTFYIAGVYFCNAKNKKIAKGIAISLFSTVFAAICACLICRFI